MALCAPALLIWSYPLSFRADLSAQTPSVRLQKADLQYEGAFRVPPAQSAERNFAYGAMGMAYNPATNSLFLTGHIWYQLTAEIGVPAIRNASTVGALATAPLLQRIEALERARERFIYRGVWIATEKYEQHNMCTFSGSLWMALRVSTGQAPGRPGGFWQLCCKRGADGKDGKHGKDAK